MKGVLIRSVVLLQWLQWLCHLIEKFLFVVLRGKGNDDGYRAG